MENIPEQSILRVSTADYIDRFDMDWPGCVDMGVTEYKMARTTEGIVEHYNYNRVYG